MDITKKEPNTDAEYNDAPWIFAVAVLLFTAATSAQAEERMGAVVMRDLTAGNTWSGKTENGAVFNIYFSPDGRMSAQSNWDSETHYDLGTWEVTDDGKFCRQFDRWRGGAYDCFRMYRLGPNRFRLKAIDEPYDSIYRFRTGDPEGLRVRM